MLEGSGSEPITLGSGFRVKGCIMNTLIALFTSGSRTVVIITSILSRLSRVWVLLDLVRLQGISRAVKKPRISWFSLGLDFRI